MSSATAAPITRPRPSRVTPQSQSARANAIKAERMMITPVGPASCARTQTSQAAPPYMGKARNCLKVSIQGPGLGMKARARGHRPRSKNGRAKPTPSAMKISNAKGADNVRAKPSAAAMKGAVQGAATATASTPVKKAPTAPLRDANPPPAVMEPTSNRPERLRPTAKTSSAKPATAGGGGGGGPRPARAPPARGGGAGGPS